MGGISLQLVLTLEDVALKLASHFNKNIALITEYNEKLEIAKLNLIAGKKA